MEMISGVDEEPRKSEKASVSQGFISRMYKDLKNKITKTNNSS